MIKISIVTPTVRPKGLELVKKALENQEFKDFEWLIISPKEISIAPLRSKKIRKIRILKDPPKKEQDVWSLNKAYNEAIKKANGQLIVLWQDNTYADSDALEKFWFYYTVDPKALVSGVGNKYESVLPNLGKLVWKDPRESEHKNGVFPCYFHYIEANFCAVPKLAFFVAGGFDEYLDQYFGMDAFSVFDRLQMLGGWKFYIDQTNNTYSLPHERLEHWEEKNAIRGPYQERKKVYLVNPVLEYLK